MPAKGWVRRYCDLFTPMSEAPAEAHMATALAVLSAAIGWRAYIKWGTSSEPCCLFVMLQGASATAKKTTTARTGSNLIRYSMQALGQQGADPTLVARGVSHTSRLGLIEMVATPDEAKAKEWEVSPPPGFLLDWDEFGAVLGRPGDVKGSDYLGQIRATLMEFYGGRHGGIQTGERKFPATRCAVSILGTMTRAELEQRVSTGLLRDGFLGRFILVPHPGRRTYLADPPETTDEEREEHHRLMVFLRRVATSKQELGDVFGRMTDEAREVRREWYTRRMTEMDRRAERGSEVDQALADAMGRLQTTAAKISAVLAVAGMEEGEDLGEVRIGPDDVQSGINYVEFALEEIRSLATGGAGMPTDRYGDRVIDWLGKRNAAVGRKELMDMVRADGMDAATRWKVVERLHEEGRLEVTTERTGGRPRQVVTL